MLVSSANIIYCNKSDTLIKSLTWIKNKSGPKMDPCGTPHVNGSVIEEQES